MIWHLLLWAYLLGVGSLLVAVLIGLLDFAEEL